MARVETMPPLMDPKSVALLLPETKSLGVTAFVEPTVDGGACVLFAGRLPEKEEEEEEEDSSSSAKDGNEEKRSLGSILFSNTESNYNSSNNANDDIDPMDLKNAEQLIIEQFPLLEGTLGLNDAVRQLLSQRTAVASSVKCNKYHSSLVTATNEAMTPTAICGDAAHATGGVSGQGCNSALVDAAVLADCLIQHYHPTTAATASSNDIADAKRDMLHQSLLSYSKKQVPEGWALYDLSFGNDGKSLPFLRNLGVMVSNGVDSIFRGRWGIGKKPLQTLLTSSMTPFAEIRREREKYFLEEFPSDEWFSETMEQLS